MPDKSPIVIDSYKTRSLLKTAGGPYTFYDIQKLAKHGFPIDRLPYSIKILLENLLRHEDGKAVTKDDIGGLAAWDPSKSPKKEISLNPARVLLQDFTGVPAIADLAAMRDAVAQMGGDPKKINPMIPCDLVIDHSVQVDSYGSPRSLEINARRENERNRERYVFLRWGQQAFRNFRVVPPDTGIVHQVNLEYLARVVWCHAEAKENLAYPDTVVGTDSHTTMINGLGVLGWGVGGIEAEAAMLGQPITMLIPEVLGVMLKNRLPEGATATDLVLTVTETLRKKGVVGKFVEFFGPGTAHLSLADRATLSNMSPEFGSTCALFPVDAETIKYLKLTGRPKEIINLAQSYAKAQGWFSPKNNPPPLYHDVVELDLAKVTPTLAGPRRPQDRVPLTDAKKMFERVLPSYPPSKGAVPIHIGREKTELKDGSVVIAAITSCTNTSNPSVLIAAGLAAKKALQKGLSVKPWVKTSLAPGSKVVTEYLRSSGLLSALEGLNFHLVGYGCTTCIGNSGPLPEPVASAIEEGDLVAVAVLSGNRNFEGRIHPHVRANYLASPPLVVAYAIAGRMDWDPYNEPMGKDLGGRDVFLKDIWPTSGEIEAVIHSCVKRVVFEEQYSGVFEGDNHWREIKIPSGDRFRWEKESTYVRPPPFFENRGDKPPPLSDIRDARVLVMLGDSVTTDHISPAGSISRDSPAGKFLMEKGVEPQDFNSFGSRRGNHEVMIRGTFGNSRLKNLLTPGVEGGMTRLLPEGGLTTIYDASCHYERQKIPLIALAGKEYGSGSSRDWAAKGVHLLGIKAVMAESFERIHRSNLIGMGVLPLQFKAGENRASLGLTGEERYTISGVAHQLTPGGTLKITADNKPFDVITRIDTPIELEYYRHGGILPYMLRQFV